MVVGVKHGKYMYHFDLYMHDMLPLKIGFHGRPLVAIFYIPLPLLSVLD